MRPEEVVLRVVQLACLAADRAVVDVLVLVAIDVAGVDLLKVPGSNRDASLVGKAIPLLHTRENASGLNESRSCYYDERAWINREIRQRAKSSLVTTKLCVCLLRVEEKQFQAYRKQSKYTIL